MTVNTDITGGSSFGTTMDHGSRPYLAGVTSIHRSLGQAANDSIVTNPADIDAIEFRVSRAGESRRRLRLTGNRYTFGNAEGCAIRLNDPSLRPMHAVLIREAGRIVVRAYSVPIDVNGQRTTEANLHSGDVLRLGVYEFELIAVPNAHGVRSTGRKSPENRDPIQPTAPLGAAGSPRPSELPPSDEIIWRERLRREVDQWRQRQDDCDRREGRINEREAELRARESELWSRSDNLHRREARVQSQETETFHLYEEFAQRQQELIRLRDESQTREDDLKRREAEFREQEFEYRRRLSEATAQLDHSKLQAEAATLAVSRMREQFDALNAQIAKLSNDQHGFSVREKQQAEEFDRSRRELEAAKADAELGRQQSEQLRDKAEDRIAELTAEIALLKSSRGTDFHEQQSELEESKQISQQLRDQIAELQTAVAEASEESARLRCDYEQSCVKVLQLEALVSESQQRGDQDRDQWAIEAEQLRAEVDRLSNDLASANDQLAEIRDANESLNQRLHEVRQERDDARIERDVRPTTEAYQKLREELEIANDQLTEMKRQYDEMLTRISDAQSSRCTDISTGLGLASDVETIGNSTAVDTYAETEHRSIENASSIHDNDDVWPTYQSAPDGRFVETASDEIENLEDSIATSDDDPSLAIELEQSSTESVWGISPESDAAQLELDQSSDSDRLSIDNLPQQDPWKSAAESDTNESWEAESTQTDSANSIVQGSLASELIKDLDNEREYVDELDPNRYADSGSYLGDPKDGYGDLPDLTPDATFLLTDGPETPAWVSSQATPDSGFDEPYEGEHRGASTSPWDDVSDQSHAFLDADDAADEEFDAPIAETAQTPVDVTSKIDEAPTEEEDSIEAYMNRLLRRVQGNGEDQAEIPMPETISVSTSQSQYSFGKTSTKSSPEEETSVKESLLIDQDAPLVPRSQAPERSGNLSAMRDLANSSARSAISRSARVQSRDTQIQAMVSFACALGALACNAIAFYFLSGILLIVAVVMTLIVAYCCIRDGMHLLREAKRRVSYVEANANSNADEALG